MTAVEIKDHYDVVVIGGGAAGLAGASKAVELGLDTLIIENSERLGGIPYQCTHPGFGNFYLNENLTGSEFSEYLIGQVLDKKINHLTTAHVTGIRLVSDMNKEIKLVTPEGIMYISAKTILYTTGARERHVHETGIKGDRVAGIYTAGETQTLMDIYGILPGKKVVIVGSGDIGLIMARRFALEGACVVGVIEMLSYPGGLPRNVVQCLHDFDIPLYTNRVVTEIQGKKRVEKVVTTEVDKDFNIVKNSEKVFECDTVALATGLIPYTKILDDMGVEIDPLTKGPVVNDYLETSIPGVFAAGNVLAINDYVDYASEQGELAAIGAKIFIDQSGIHTTDWKHIIKQGNVRMIVPHMFSGLHDITLYVRVKKPRPKVTIRLVEIGKEIKQQGVTPGQMIKIPLTKEELCSIEHHLTLEVSP